MIGYVNADSKRRGMNSLLWTLLVIFVPKALGFIAYFLLRKPLLIPCPNCGAVGRIGLPILPEVWPCLDPELQPLRPLHQPRLRVLPVLRKTGGSDGDFLGPAERFSAVHHREHRGFCS